MLNEHPDTDLLVELQKNGVPAFNTIYGQHSKALYIYLLHKLKDPELCNDILQDIFVTLWEKRADLTIEHSFKAYLYQAARYKIIDIYRRDVKYQHYLAGLAEFILVNPESITDRIDQRQQLREIEIAISKLPDRMREIFILSRFEHQTTRDIADKTNLSPQTVKNQLSKALRILRINYMSVDIVFLFFLLLLRK